MERYKLSTLFDSASTFNTALGTALSGSPLLMGITSTTDVLGFVASTIYGYFYDDVVSYEGEDVTEVTSIFMNRLSYDIAIKFPYWFKKYQYVKKLLTTDDLSLLQTSKMTSSSTESANTTGASLQKLASTPTGVSQTTATDTITLGETAGVHSVSTDGFVDKYTNTQQKFASANQSQGIRSGEILREGSIDELLNVLEKLPSSFANEINIVLQKHFIFDYDGEMKGYYTEN